MPTLRYLGHSACTVVRGARTVLIDPFLTGNPVAAARPDDFSPDAILVSHAHGDHLGDTAAIARRSGAMVVGGVELMGYLERQGVERTHGMNLGGAHAFPWGWVKLTPAWHSASVEDPALGSLETGTPAGLMLRVGEKLIYHAGDTALFGDMALIGRHGIDLALIPIGDNYTMGPDDALEAVRLLQPRAVVPIHYDTFPLIAQDGPAWARRVEQELGIQAVALRPGESIQI